jgi:hypothetical protein
MKLRCTRPPAGYATWTLTITRCSACTTMRSTPCCARCCCSRNPSSAARRLPCTALKPSAWSPPLPPPSCSRGFEGAGRLVPANGHYLAKLAVAPHLRGRGIGGRLLAHFMAEATAAGRTPCLHVRRDNEGALALYRRHGFTVDLDPASATHHYWLLRAPDEEST